MKIKKIRVKAHQRVVTAAANPLPQHKKMLEKYTNTSLEHWHKLNKRLAISPRSGLALLLD